MKILHYFKIVSHFSFFSSNFYVMKLSNHFVIVSGFYVIMLTLFSDQGRVSIT